jgi:hypothetical protein
MKGRQGACLVLLILTGMTVSSAIDIPQVSADMIVISYMTEGAAVHNGTHVCMPEASVRVNIKANGSIYTDLQADFSLLTNTTQNVTLGFVVPEVSAYSGGMSSNLTISMNNGEINYSILEWNDLGVAQGFSTELIDELGTWLTQVKYAVFSLEMQANLTANLIVASSQVYSSSYINEFVYSYVIASARTFEGNTHEIVHMNLVETVPFLNVSFLPDSYLTLTKNGMQSDAIWDLNVSEFGDNSVQMFAVIREYQGGPRPVNHIEILFAAAVIVVIAVPLILKLISRLRKVS